MVTEFRPRRGETAEHDRPEQSRPDQRFSILIADDDRGTRETLGEVLQDRGYHTVLAADGGEAVELVQVELVHLVLFDMHMPRLTGLEALTLLRHTLGRIPPAVLMTADATTDLMRQAFQAQVFSVIPKPVNKNIVLHTLVTALTRVYGTPAEPPPAGRPTAGPVTGPTTGPASPRPAGEPGPETTDRG